MDIEANITANLLERDIRIVSLHLITIIVSIHGADW